MSIQDWGSLGEVIGALGLLITVCFLAYELRLTRDCYRLPIGITLIDVRNETFWSNVIGWLLDLFNGAFELTLEFKHIPTLDQIKARITPNEFIGGITIAGFFSISKRYLNSLERYHGERIL